jgi:predicted SnoaL-like aldol condensation-catalyzing enzyme
MPDVAHNKAVIRDFYDLAFNQHRPQEAVARHVGAHYTQHNPQVGDGPQAFVDFVTDFARRHPALHAQFKRVIAEGEYVVLHAHVRVAADDPGMAAIDIFRLSDGKIVEHWDVLQPVAGHSANNNGMF